MRRRIITVRHVRYVRRTVLITDFITERERARDAGFSLLEVKLIRSRESQYFLPRAPH